MSIQKINIGGADVEIEDASARTSITNINNTIGSETLQTTSKTLKGAINEVKQSIGASGGGGGGLPCIDTNHLIYQQSLISNTIASYTATEDCVMCLSLCLWGNGTYIAINNNRVFDANESSGYGAPSFMTLNLKKGDIFYFYPKGNVSNRISFKVFGIRY